MSEKTIKTYKATILSNTEEIRTDIESLDPINIIKCILALENIGIIILRIIEKNYHGRARVLFYQEINKSAWKKDLEAYEKFFGYL